MLVIIYKSRFCTNKKLRNYNANGLAFFMVLLLSGVNHYSNTTKKFWNRTNYTTGWIHHCFKVKMQPDKQKGRSTMQQIGKVLSFQTQTLR